MKELNHIYETLESLHGNLTQTEKLILSTKSTVSYQTYNYFKTLPNMADDITDAVQLALSKSLCEYDEDRGAKFITLFSMVLDSELKKMIRGKKAKKRNELGDNRELLFSELIKVDSCGNEFSELDIIQSTEGVDDSNLIAECIGDYYSKCKKSDKRRLDAWRLHHILGIPNKDIAKMYHTTEGNVAKLTLRGRKLIQERILCI